MTLNSCNRTRQRLVRFIFTKRPAECHRLGHRLIKTTTGTGLNITSNHRYQLPEDSPQKIRHKEDSPHNKCDREFERKRPTNVCNSADVENSPHNGDRLGSGGGSRELGLGGFRSGSWVGPGGRRVGVGGGQGRGSQLPDPNSPDPNPLAQLPGPTPRPNPPTQPLEPTPRLQPPNPNPPNPTPPRPQPITIVWLIFHIGTVANVCPMLTLKFSVTFVRLTRCMANLCGESFMWQILWQPRYLTFISF